jgi:hypothetical protein
MPWSIREVIDLVSKGQIRIPSFQRGFVWDAERVAFLMDSIYKKYPFGSILIWQTKNALRTERRLGPYELTEVPPEYPLYYVLDGQQRITSLFGVFQTDLKAVKDESWMNVYFDFKADPNAQDSQFVALDPSEADPQRYFPLNALFDTVAYRKATKDLDDDDVAKVDAMQSTFKETQLPVQIITKEDKSSVAMIFERINRAGVPLDTLQLLSAWTWSEDFALHEQFSELSEDLEPFGFQEVGDDANLLLRCCAAIIKSQASPEVLIDVNGSVIRGRFSELVNGVKGAIDFLRRELNVERVTNLPFSSVIVPLSVFFAVPGTTQVKYTDEQRRVLVRWFWRSAFSKRFSSGVLRNLTADVIEMAKLRDKQKNTLGDFNVLVKEDFFLDNVFKLSSVNTQTFIMMLAGLKPRSFISGAGIDLASVLREYNKAEFHHLYPQAFLKNQKIVPELISCLANFCFLSKSDNNDLSGDAPSIYKKKMPKKTDEILKCALCPPSLFEDNYEKFLKDRVKLLTTYAEGLIK